MLRRAPGSLFRWSGGPDAPKSAWFPVPVGRGSRCSEERRLPCPEWGGGPDAPKSSGFPVPMRPCARRSEECRLPCPSEAVRAALRRVPVAVPRWVGVLPTKPWSLAVSRWGAAPPKRSGSLSRWNGGPDAPKSSRFPVPVRSCARPSEECRLPCLGEVVRPALRRVPLAVPRGTGPRVLRRGRLTLSRVERDSRCSEERRLSCPGGRESCPVGRGRVCEEEVSMR